MADLLPRLKARLDITDATEDKLLKECLDSATWSYVELRFPASPYVADNAGEPVIEKRYEAWVVSAAAEFYNKIGAEGQVGHSENGIDRAYESAHLSESLRMQITPRMGIAR